MTLKNSSEQGILGILLQTVIKRVLLLFYGITFNLDKIKSQIEFHSKAEMLVEKFWGMRVPNFGRNFCQTLK